MSFRLILFDIDGTLMRASGAGRWAMARAFEQTFSILDADPFIEPVSFDGNTDLGIVREVARNAALPPEELESRREEMHRHFLRHLEARLLDTPTRCTLPGVIDLLDRLAPVSMAGMGLLTGNVRDGAMLKLASVGLDRYFTPGACSSTGFGSQPLDRLLGGFGDDAADRAGIGQVARRRFEEQLGRSIAPSEVIAVGDSAEDVRAARANGFRSISVGTGWTNHALLRSLEPDLFVDDLSDYGRIMQFIFGSKG